VPFFANMIYWHLFFTLQANFVKINLRRLQPRSSIIHATFLPKKHCIQHQLHSMAGEVYYLHTVLFVLFLKFM